MNINMAGIHAALKQVLDKGLCLCEDGPTLLKQLSAKATSNQAYKTQTKQN